jgi:hypothetical protein
VALADKFEPLNPNEALSGFNTEHLAPELLENGLRLALAIKPS